MDSLGMVVRVGVALGVSILLAVMGCSTVGPVYQMEPNQPAPILATAEIEQRILLIGDAGEPLLGSEGGPGVLDLLAEAASEAPEKTVVIFLGDNLYPSGMHPVADSARQNWVLGTQLEALRSGAKGIFLPGNHDWADADPTFGYDAIRRQGIALGSHRPALDVRLLPDTIGGCPGPVSVDLPGVRIVTLDTQWWLHDPDARGNCGSETDVTNALRQSLRGAGDREVVVVGHHPLTTTGPHGRPRWWGFVTPQAHLDPTAWWARIPVQVIWGTLGWLLRGPRGAFIGAGVTTLAYPVGRTIGFADQDLGSTRYREFRSQIGAALAEQPPLVYAAGHEHSVQVHFGALSAEYEIVSGAGSDAKLSPITGSERTLFAQARPSFVSLDFLTDGGVLLKVLEPGGNVPYWWWLRER